MLFKALCRLNLQCYVRRTFPVRTFYEPYRSGDQKYERKDEDDKSMWWHAKNGMVIFKREMKLYLEEVKELMKVDPKRYEPGDTDILFKLSCQEELNKWKVTSDLLTNDGFSWCELILNKYNHGLFHGFIDKRLPKDGNVIRTGFCNITRRPPPKSFFRETVFDWQPCTHLVFRVRGDGRSYSLLLHTGGYYDVNWHDTYNFILYTRGGPYWQFAKIPFSRFMLTSKGRIQDKQARVNLDRIKGLGITLADHAEGPFHLEIDYIGLHWDPNFTEEFAYEMYNVPKLGLY